MDKRTTILINNNPTLSHPHKVAFFLPYLYSKPLTMKQLMNDYWAPTPKKWRKIGDALLGVSTTITGFAIASDNHFIAYTALICGVLGKLITNLFTETEQT